MRSNTVVFIPGLPRCEPPWFLSLHALNSKKNKSHRDSSLTDNESNQVQYDPFLKELIEHLLASEFDPASVSSLGSIHMACEMPINHCSFITSIPIRNYTLTKYLNKCPKAQTKQYRETYNACAHNHVQELD